MVFISVSKLYTTVLKFQDFGHKYCDTDIL